MGAETAVAKKKKVRFRRTRAFWARVTEGLEIQQLWGQFISEAKASYGLYSKDVDWEQIGSERGRFRRARHSIWAMFMAMLMKLSPPRRVTLLLALILLVIDVDFGVTGAVESGLTPASSAWCFCSSCSRSNWRTASP